MTSNIIPMIACCLSIACVTFLSLIYFITDFWWNSAPPLIFTTIEEITVDMISITAFTWFHTLIGEILEEALGLPKIIRHIFLIFGIGLVISAHFLITPIMVKV